MKPKDNINYIDKTVEHTTHGIGKVVEEAGDQLKVLFEKGGEKPVHANSVTIIENKDTIDYTAYLTYASDEIKEMFNAFTPEQKKKYAEVVKHTPTQTEFHFDVNKKDGSKQDAIYKINKQDKNIPEAELKSGFVEKYEEAGYKGPEFLANKDARAQYTPEGQGLTIARFKALAKQMPAGDFKGIGTDKPCIAIRQLYISLGGKRSEYRPVNAIGVVGKKVPANGEDYGYNNVKGKKYPEKKDDDQPYINPEFTKDSSLEREAPSSQKGYFALDDFDENGNVVVISAHQNPEDYPKGTAFTTRKENMYPWITLAEQPTIKYTNKEGQETDKDGNILPAKK